MGLILLMTFFLAMFAFRPLAKDEIVILKISKAQFLEGEPLKKLTNQLERKKEKIIIKM